MSSTPGPLLVFGPRSLAYDFGPSHPLTPRRFGPGIDLLRHVGAVPGLEPEPVADDALLRLHLPELCRRGAQAVGGSLGRGCMGLGLADNPAFAGMHEAAAAVAGGSLAAMEAILAGRTLHAHHPGGGLHHAMAGRAWGFCIYNDVALAVVRARTEGLRVLYVDLDVHHGDGVQALTARRSGRPHAVAPRERPVPVPRDRVPRRARGADRRPGLPSTCRSSRIAARRHGWPP